MKKVVLFFVMMLLVLMSARSLLCKSIYSIAKEEHTRLTGEFKHVLSQIEYFFKNSEKKLNKKDFFERFFEKTK